MGHGGYQICTQVFTTLITGSITERTEASRDDVTQKGVAPIGPAGDSHRMGAHPETRLADVGSEGRERSGAGFSVIHVAMLPVQPRMTEFMGKNIPTSSDWKPFA